MLHESCKMYKVFVSDTGDKDKDMRYASDMYS